MSTVEKSAVKQDQKRILAVDVDGTLADVTTPWLELIKNEYGKEITKKDAVEYHLENIVGVPRENLLKLLKKTWDEPDKIQLEDPDIPNILLALKSKYEIHILTATMGDDATVRKWLDDHHIPYDKFVHVNRSAEKAGYNADVFVDDNFEVAASVAAQNKLVLLISQPWNQAEAANKTQQNIVVIKKWDETEKLLLMSLLRR